MRKIEGHENGKRIPLRSDIKKMVLVLTSLNIQVTHILFNQNYNVCAEATCTQQGKFILDLVRIRIEGLALCNHCKTFIVLCIPEVQISSDVSE